MSSCGSLLIKVQPGLQVMHAAEDGVQVLHAYDAHTVCQVSMVDMHGPAGTVYSTV